MMEFGKQKGEKIGSRKTEFLAYRLFFPISLTPAVHFFSRWLPSTSRGWTIKRRHHLTTQDTVRNEFPLLFLFWEEEFCFFQQAKGAGLDPGPTTQQNRYPWCYRSAVLYNTR